jgi:hypothetical protein
LGDKVLKRLITKFFSAIVGVVSLLGLLAFYGMARGQLSDLTSSIFWFGFVGLIIALIYGTAASYFIDWLLKILKVEGDNVKYNTSFILLHVIVGTVIPILGNIVSFFFSVNHLLIEKGRKKEILFYFLCMVLLIVSGVMLDSKLSDSNNMQMIDMTRFFGLFIIGSAVIGFSAYLFIGENLKLKLIIFFLSTCIVFLPSTLNLLEARHDFKTRYKQDPELAKLYEKIKDRYPDLELDLVRSNDNVETLDLTINKSSIGFSSLAIKNLINDIPMREGGFSLQLYEKEEFLYITVDSGRKVVECENSNAEESICGELLKY